MVGRQGERTKVIGDLLSNLMNAINESCETLGNDVTPTSSSGARGCLPPLSITKPNGKGASTSIGEETTHAMERLLEAWLTDTLVSTLN